MVTLMAQLRRLLIKICGSACFRAKHYRNLKTIATLASALFIAGGFAATWIQMSNATRVVQAANTYQIQKDSRELSDRVYTREYMRILDSANSSMTYVMTLEDAESCNKSVKCFRCKKDQRCDILDHLFRKGTWLMFNFYLSVYRQSKLEVIPPEIAEAFSIDFCKFLKNKPVKKIWLSIVDGVEDSGGTEDDHSGNRRPAGFAAMQKNWCPTDIG